MYKKQPQKKTSTRKSSGTKKKTSAKAKKAKVYIPAYKAIILCAVIITICLCLLLVTTVKTEKPSAPAPAPITERFEEQKPVKPAAEPIPAPTPKKEAPKKEAPAPKKETAKKDQPKVEPPAQTKKVEPEKPAVKAPVVTPPAPAEAKPAQPEKKEQKVPANKSYNFPAAKNNAKLILVFDDGGQNLNHAEKFLKLPFPITVAVLPQLAYSKQVADKVRASGNELILHQPMQSISNKVNPGPGAITPEMTEAQIISQLFININEIGPIAGLNNHEGSLITADAEKMAIILQTATEYGIYFLDSRTNVETKVPYVAHEMGYSYYERNIFLDNEKTKENVLKEFRKGLDIANKNGTVIMIGHVWSADFLPDLLADMYPELKEKGYTFTTVSKTAPKY